MPFWMAQVLMMTSSSRIMGAAFVNARSTKALAWAISAAVILINGWLTYVFAAENLSQSPVSIAALCVGVVAYLAFVTYLVIGPERVAQLQGQTFQVPAEPKAEQLSAEHSADAAPLLEAGQSSSSQQDSDP